MRVRILTALLLTFVLIFSACGKQEAEHEATASAVSTETEQKNEQMTSDDVINSVFVDMQKVYEETMEDLKANGGQNIGTDYDQREVTDEGVMYKAVEGENPFMPLAKRLNEVDGINGYNQAFYMKFKPSAKDFAVMLNADGNVGITIGEDNEPALFVADYEYMEPLDTNLRIEPGNWYHVIIGIGSDGLIQGALWKEGSEDEAVYMNLHLSQSFGDERYSNQSWMVNVGYSGEATFTVDNYAYYTFSNFVMADRVIEVSNDDMGSQMPQSAEEVVGAMIENPHMIFGEGIEQMAENGGGQFGSGVAEKRINLDEGRMELFSGDNMAYMSLNTRLKDFWDEDRTQQAILIKFQPEDVNNLYFNFLGMGEFSISFESDDVYYVDVPNFSKFPFSDFAVNDFQLKWDSLYYIFVAFDEEAQLRCLVWEEGNYENQAYLERNMYEGMDGIYESNWLLSISFQEYGQLNLYEYSIYTFDSMKSDPTVTVSFQDNNNQDGGGQDMGESMPQDPMEMASTLLNNPQVIFMEDASSMDENNGKNFGDVSEKRLSNDGRYYQFISNDDGAYMPGNINFLDMGEFRDNAQAIMFKFQPENVDGLAFALSGAGEVVLSFENNQPIFAHVTDYFSAPYANYRDTGLNIEQDKWYWAVMAFDSAGNYRSLVWEDQNSDNNAYCGEDISQWHGEYGGSNWHFRISFGPNQTLNLQEYYIMDFEGFTDMGY